MRALPIVGPEPGYTMKTATSGPSGFADFTYSKRHHFSIFISKGDYVPDCDLKVYQDCLVYDFLLGHLPAGSRILEVGGGDSRIIASLKGRYEMWNADPLEGAGNGLHALPDAPEGYRHVPVNLGAHSPKLPDRYFDLVFSISVLEHVSKEPSDIRRILADQWRVLAPGGLALHCIDARLHPSIDYVHPIIDIIQSDSSFIGEPRSRDDALADKYLWHMSQTSYEGWWQPTTRTPWEEFGRPMSFNLLSVTP